MKLWLRAVLALFGLAAVLFVGLASWDNLTARGSVPDPVRSHDVRIERDKWGVPHIHGKTDADVAYGLAIAHAEDDFPTLEESIAGVRGRGGAILGADGAKFDFAGAFLNANQIAEQHYGDLSPATRKLVEAYARGLNHYAAQHPSELRLRGLFPVNGKDIVAGFVLRSPFFFGLDRPLAALIDNQPPPRDSGPPDERGSNGFAVSGRRSSDGVTRLIVNSHQPWTGAVAWYEVVVHSGQGWDFAGALFPGVPTPVVGHNKTLGWTHTVNRPDLIDTFKLTLDAKGENYSVDGKWLPLQKSRVWLRVKFGPLTLPIPRTLYGSIYGPVVRNDNGAFAIRYAGLGDVRAVEQWYRLTKARDFAEWQKVMAMQAIPNFNTVYADASGHIGMFYNARFPVRAKGHDWKGVVPGDTMKTLWTAYHPFAADPMVIDPPAGWVANSNNHPFLSTAPADEQSPAAFPAEMGVETFVTNRALRYQALFAALGDKPISRDDLLRIKFDKSYDRNGWAGNWYREAMALDTAKAPDLAAAQKLIGTWDWTLDCQGAADAIVTTAFAQAARFAYTEKPRPDTAASLREAVDLLMTHYGRIDPPLGDFQRLRRAKVDLPLCGGPEALRAIIGDLSDDGRRVGNSGDSFIMLIEWPANGPVRSQSVHQFGAATLRPASPHYADQAPLFAAEKWKTVDFDPAAKP